ncbi:MAG: winged helix-turn-helix transcriptional regulator [Shinella sp.]|uniref:winged helix-turn-helix transcriptional regulator n=1 Tax=Shinella sp. TaxID=1870904 RepID=UPI0040351B73
MTDGSYSQFCPVAMASEVLCSRWTMIVVRELICGSTRFNDLKRGVPRMSPALLSKRLKDLEAAGVVERVATGGSAAAYEYRLTPAGRELEPIVRAMGFWGQRWVETAPTLQNVDPELLMWDMRRSIKVAALPRQRTVVQFSYIDRPEKKRRYWLVIEANGAVDVCSLDPGFEVDLYVTTDLRTMTAIWLGLTTIRAESSSNRFTAVGNRELEDQMPTWLGLSAFATEQKLAQT